MPSSLSAKQSKPKTFSFDVFDTCITRYCAQPADLFELLFTKLLTGKGLSTQALETTAKALARSRIGAERSTRDRSTRDDITLTEIYQTLAPSLQPYGISPAQAAAEEIEVELSAVSPIVNTQRRVRRLRLQGHQIIFISDMYLPGSVIRQMLIEHGFTNGEDSVYVSSDTGLSKGSGRLFAYACDEHGLELNQLHHTGDSIYADIRGAQRLGVQTTFFTQGAPNRYETGFRSELVGNNWVRSHLIGLSRSVRLRHDFGAQSRERATLAADVIAPLLVGYVAWVLTTAQQEGVQQLYFVDSGLLAIAQNIAWAWQQSDSQALPTLQPAAAIPHHQPDGELKSDRSQVLSASVGIDWRLDWPITDMSQGLHFGLLNLIEQPQTVSYQRQMYLAYLEAPMSPSKLPEGMVYLFEYRQILSLFLSAASADELISYREILLDYAAVFGRSPALKHHLDMLKRYAIRNAVKFLANPKPADVRSLVALQAALHMKEQQDEQAMKNRAIARPIRLWELPAFAKRLIQGAKAESAATRDRWIEGSMAISPIPFQMLLTGLSQCYRVFSQKLAPNQAKWFYRIR